MIIVSPRLFPGFLPLSRREANLSGNIFMLPLFFYVYKKKNIWDCEGKKQTREIEMTNSKPTPTWPSYAASACGKVFSIEANWRNLGQREMSQQSNSHGYPSVRLIVNGKRKKIAVHRLVADAWLPPRPSKDYEICHIDGDKNNNRAENLRWGTRKDNAYDRKLHGKEKKGCEKCGKFHRSLSEDSLCMNCRNLLMTKAALANCGGEQ